MGTVQAKATAVREFSIMFEGVEVAKFEVNAHDSATGKTVVLASSHGNIPTSAQYDGKPIIVGFNAYVRK